MRVLEFEVRQCRLNKKAGCDFRNIVSGAGECLQAKFIFSKEWSGCVKVASFFSPEGYEYCRMLDKDDCCDIPTGALSGEYFEVEVTGSKTELINDTYKIQSSTYRVNQVVK